MATESTSVASFTAGVVDRTAQSRVDVRRLALGAKTQTNWLSHVLGYMSLRPGLRYVGIVDPPTGLPTRGSGSAEITVSAAAVGEENPFLFLLLHGNGTDGNNLVDMSDNNHVPTTVAGLNITASPDAWGGSAIETAATAGVADYQEYVLPFAAAGQAFTLEYFLQIIVTSGDGDGFAEFRQEVLRLWGSADTDYKHTANCAIHSSAHHLFTTPAAQSCLHSTFGISGKTQRVHVVYQRQAGGGTQLFLQGRYVGESGLTTGAIGGLRIGGPGISSRTARAWIDGLRFLKGYAAYPPRVLQNHGEVVFTTLPTVPFTPDEV